VNAYAVGLRYQLRTFAEQGLKVNFMVESLFSAVPAVGPEPLNSIVRSIMAGGHDIQLHPHPEWIPYIPDLDVSYKSHLLREYSLLEQEAIIRFARKRLESAGAPTPVAFRAAGFAADSNTLSALKHCGITFDTSFNLFFKGDNCHLPTPKAYGRPTDIEGVQEFPVAVFEDRPFHFRHAQVCACSAAEMIHALDSAEREGWEFFVIVSHSFEMLTRRRHATKPPQVRQAVVDRFEKICKFLNGNRDRFKTVGFSDLHSLTTSDKPETPLKGKLLNTANRAFEQALHRIQTR
jgi:hypothetical protein